MKALSILFLCITVASFNMGLKAQLSVYAGPDTILCDSDFQGYPMGNLVEVTGDYDSIRFSWSCEYKTPVGTYYASSFLNDTSILNPILTNPLDTLLFTLNVYDGEGNMASDTVRILLSQFTYCLAECREQIQQGDSVMLGHCIFGGIPPHKYSWSHGESLSDPSSARPWARPAVTTEYLLTLTDSAGCIANSRCMVYVDPVSVDKSTLPDQKIQLYPNPGRQGETINIENFGNQKFEICFYDEQGKTLFRETIHPNQHSLTSNNMKPGIYVYTIIMEGKFTRHGRLVIE